MNWASASIPSYRYPRRSRTGYASFKSLNTEKEKKNMGQQDLIKVLLEKNLKRL